jgi:hypothetical protein
MYLLMLSIVITVAQNVERYGGRFLGRRELGIGDWGLETGNREAEGRRYPLTHPLFLLLQFLVHSFLWVHI